MRNIGFVSSKFDKCTLICRFGKPRQVPDSYNERINKACKAIALKDSEQENVKPFMFGGFDVIEIGMVCSVLKTVLH